MSSRTPDPAAEWARLQRSFRDFARDLPQPGGQVYAALCDRLADDPDRAGLALRAAPAFRTPLILLAAVHHLLLTGTEHPLSAYYATVIGDAARHPDDRLYPAFASFVDEHRTELEALIASRSTQTNEARRTVLTLPALHLVVRESGLPLALLEVGASAGLNLLPDRYGYRIGERVAGDPASPLQLACEVEGELLPPVPADKLPIAWRLGLDLNPLDVRDPATRSWLRALVWPEHRDRMATLDAALGIARRDPPLVVRGDLLTDLGDVAATAPADAALAVISTWVLAYVEPASRLAFLGALRRIAANGGRSVWLVACEAQSVLATLDAGLAEAPADGYGPSTLSLHRFDPDGGGGQRQLAECHAHGRWIRWQDEDSAASPA
jgi:hypothetical protein